MSVTTEEQIIRESCDEKRVAGWTDEEIAEHRRDLEDLFAYEISRYRRMQDKEDAEERQRGY